MRKFLEHLHRYFMCMSFILWLRLPIGGFSVSIAVVFFFAAIFIVIVVVATATLTQRATFSMPSPVFGHTHTYIFLLHLHLSFTKREKKWFVSRKNYIRMPKYKTNNNDDS